MNDKTCVRLLVVDDHNLFRRGLIALLSRDERLSVVAEARDAGEALKLAPMHKPDVILLDNHLPGVHGVDALPQLIAAAPHARIVMLTVSEDADDLSQALSRGAAGYLLKDSAAIDIIDAVSELLAGGSPISPGIARTIVRRLGDQAKASQATPQPDRAPDHEGGRALTEREMDILWGIAKGFTYAEIAQHLQMSKHTVPVHIKNIYRKLHVNNRSEAVYEASRRGLIRL